jgi:SAM-dependent methyltransferase
MSSTRSAAHFIARLEFGFQPRRVLDVGCGRGVWLEAWKRHGVESVLGLDCSYVDFATLRIDRREFVPTDLARPFDLGCRFDLVQCLEVAEHLPSAAASTLTSSVVRHGDIVLFAAATPGQGGEHHVNEQPIAYWVERFRALGFAAYDYPRLAVRGVAGIEPWYRYNTLLFASERGAARLSDAVRRTLIPSGARIPDCSTYAWKVRGGIIRAMPRPIVHRLARLKHRLVS